MRAEAEDVYGMKLGDIGAATDKITGGFGRDDGASVRKVLIFRRFSFVFSRGWLTDAM